MISQFDLVKPGIEASLKRKAPYKKIIYHVRNVLPPADKWLAKEYVDRCRKKL